MWGDFLSGLAVGWIAGFGSAYAMAITFVWLGKRARRPR